MSILDRLGKVFKANINSVIDKMEDPEKMLEQNIYEMEKAYLAAKKSIASTKAEEIRLVKQVKFLEQEVDKWTQNAKAAISKGNEELAKKALVKKSELTSELDMIRKDLDSISQNVSNLVNDLKNMETKIKEAKRKKELLKSRLQSAEAKKKINELKSQSGIAENGAFESFMKMEEKANKMINEVDAMEEINGELSGEDLESQFSQLSTDSSIDDELEKLKAELN